MFEKWVYLSRAHRVSKRTGVRQKGYHFVGDPFYKNLSPMDSVARFNGNNPEVLKVTQWESVTDSIDEFTEEAREYNRNFDIENLQINNSIKKVNQEEQRKRIEAIVCLKGYLK